MRALGGSPISSLPSAPAFTMRPRTPSRPDSRAANPAPNA
jgi:hypothetical protein